MFCMTRLSELTAVVDSNCVSIVVGPQVEWWGELSALAGDRGSVIIVPLVV